MEFKTEHLSVEFTIDFTGLTLPVLTSNEIMGQLSICFFAMHLWYPLFPELEKKKLVDALPSPVFFLEVASRNMP